MVNDSSKPKKSKKGQSDESSFQGNTPTSPPSEHPPSAGASPVDHFRNAANAIDRLRLTNPVAARQLWKALKESSETDTSGELEPTLFTVGKIAIAISYSPKSLLKLGVFLTVRQSYEYAIFRPELIGELSPTLASYVRTFKELYRSKIGRGPFDFGIKKRPRYALTYAELLHLASNPGLELLAELDEALLSRLENL